MNLKMQKLLFTLIPVLIFPLLVECRAPKASELEKAICECCKKKDGIRVCNDINIDTAKSAINNSDKCFFKMNSFVSISGTYWKQRNTMHVNKFKRWCREVVAIGAEYVDVFALSTYNLYCPHDLKVALFDSMYDKNNKIHYDIASIHELIQCTNEQFWMDFYDKISKRKEDIIACLNYLEECFGVFSAYMYNESYLDCEAHGVRYIINSIKKGLPANMNIVQRISPNGVARFSEEGLLRKICTQSDKHQKNVSPGGYEAFTPNIFTKSDWTYYQLQSFFYYTTNFYWPIDMIFAFLKTSVKDLPAMVPTADPFEHTFMTSSLESLLKAINRTCVTVEVVNGAIIDYKYTWGDIDECVSNVIQIKMHSNMNYEFPNDFIDEISTFNYFDMINSQKFDISNDLKGKPKDPGVLLNVMTYLTTYEMGHNAYIKHDVLVHDLQRLGTRSIINFVYLYGSSFIDDDAMQRIQHAYEEIVVNRPIIDNEKKQNIITKDDRDETYPTSLYNIRKYFGYQPVYDTIRNDENMRSWGKTVFVAFHAVVIQYNFGLIEDFEIEKSLIKCFHDIQAIEPMENYCGVFKTNPYFGEFDNVIRNFYVEAKLIENITSG